MTCFLELGHAGGRGFPAMGPKPIELTSGAFGVKLPGSHDLMLVTSDEPGWLHVSKDSHKDKAAVGKSRRILPGIARELTGIGGGMFVSFIADSQGHAIDGLKTEPSESAL